jgi:hypothetical protein
MAVRKTNVVEFEVSKPDGRSVGAFHIRRDLHVSNLRDAIAKRTGTCKGSFQLLIDSKVTRDCRSISAIASNQSHMTVKMQRKEPVLSNITECAKYCTRCLIDAGASALLLLQIWTNDDMRTDAIALHRAGFALSDVIKARDKIPSLRNAHPPPTSRTLFDSQLQLAGFTATDFRQIGYTACQMSETYFHTEDPEMSPGEREWDETMAFFTSEQLIEAGFDAEEVRFAFNPVYDRVSPRPPHCGEELLDILEGRL